MCIATATAIAALVGTAATAAGAVGSGIASGQAAQYQAQVASNNAVIAKQNAGYAATATASQTTQEGLKAAQQNAGVRAGLAANNVDVNTGSAAGVEESQRELGALDVATTAQRGAEQVYGYETQGTGYQAQSNLDASEAPYDYAGGVLKAVGDVGSSASTNPLFSGSSLVSGSPTIPSTYNWMAGNDSNDLDAAEAF